MSMIGKFLTRVVLPLGLVGCGAAGAAAMIMGAPSAESEEPETRSVPVEVVEVQPQAVPALVQATGTVEAGRQVVLTPEVQGKVVWIDPRLQPGGRFAEGESLLRIDARDYKAALAADEARLAQAELELALERKRQLTAEREWELVSGDPDAAEPLALRKPHLHVAEANLASAQAAVERSRLNVSRTTLRAPFNAVVVTENADPGQVIGGASQVATLVGTDSARVTVSVPVDQLSTLEVPGYNAESGSTVRVVASLGAVSAPRIGRLTGVSGQLDPQTRTARVIVSVDDPLVGDDPLLPGSFVDVEIVGRTLDDALAVPRVALDGGDRVWVARDGVLVGRDVTVGWRADDEVYVTGGLEAGDRVVVTGLSTPIEGMPVDATLRVAQAEE